jgi:ubiquinone/menaquinone biosynthesis C-methylase UbiE
MNNHAAVGVKSEVRDFWNRACCGEKLYLKGSDRAAFENQRRIRYELEPIREFADFDSFRGQRTLEIGVGLGADHQSLAESGAVLSGIDLTDRAIEFTRQRLELFGLKSDLNVGDAERLSFGDGSFDRVYSWGVIHHSPNTVRAIEEIFRVLKPGGVAKIMIYHKWSMVGYMLWLRYGLGRIRPWTSLKTIYANYLESPGTQAFTHSQAHEMMKAFSEIKMHSPLCHGDLLTSAAGQQHSGFAITLARRVWPRWFIKRFMGGHGLFLMITAKK